MKQLRYVQYEMTSDLVQNNQIVVWNDLEWNNHNARWLATILELSLNTKPNNQWKMCLSEISSL